MQVTKLMLRSFFRNVIRYSFVMLFAIFAATISKAQSVNYTEGNLDQSLRGNLNVDPSTLGMSFSLTMGNYSGRSVNLPVTINYGSKVWRVNYVYGYTINGVQNYTKSQPEFSERSVAGWTMSLDAPYVEFDNRYRLYDASGNAICSTCDDSPDYGYYVERITLHMPDGSSHELRKNDTVNGKYLAAPTPAASGVYIAVDGSRIKYDHDNGTVYLPDGSRYLLTASSGVQFVDRNGNTLTQNSSSRQWTDTLGRVIGFAFEGSYAHSQTVTLPGLGTGNLSYTLVWKNLADALAPIPGTNPAQYPSLRYDGDRYGTHTNPQTASPSLFPSYLTVDGSWLNNSYPPNYFNPVVLNEVILPNGQKYVFSYNEYGEMAKVKLPTGGYQRYEYGTIPVLDPNSQDTVFAQANRGVTKHAVCVTGSCTTGQEQAWTYSAVNNGSTYVTTATSPTGSKAERSLHAGGSDSYGFENAKTGRAYEERTYSASSQLLRRTLVEWTVSGPLSGGYSGATRDARDTKRVEILLDTGGDALATMTTTDYDTDLNEIESKRYDYVSVNSTTAQTAAIGSFSAGTLLRTEQFKFLVNDGDNYSQTIRDAYRVRHLIALPSWTRILNGTTIVAETQFKYDETSYPLLTYGVTIPGWTDLGDLGNPSLVRRGNVTTMLRWSNVSGSTVQSYDANNPSNNTFITTHAQYDQCGNPRKAWDANGKLSEIAYTDAFSDSVNRNTFAYPTSATTPIPDTSGYYASNQAFSSSTVYDFQTGKVVTTTDPNSKTTTYSYHDDSNNPDPLLRLRKVTLPDSLGETKYEFGDTPGSLWTRTLTKQNSTTWLEDYTYFDGLGRAWRSGHFEATNSWSIGDTEYDTLGRVKRVSNPYLAANLTDAINPSGVWTTTTYDDLNRVLTVTTPDGSKVETIYSGVQVTVKDATNKQRRSMTDGLGRLKQVVEDPAGTPLQTDYSYDTLGNLTVVNQGGQYRYFFYDSLSRLVRAKNPEQDANSALNLTNPPTYNNSWTLGYSYDANGNLTSRVDARNVTTSYGYDAFNRNVWTAYNDGITPTLERHYDGFLGGSFVVPNGKGRFFYHVNFTNNPATGGAGYSRLVVNSYDAIGRTTVQTQGFLANDGVTWKDYQVSRTYDLASHALTQTYPSGRSVSYSYAASGRLSSASGNLGGTSYTYADTIEYNAAGQMLKERFGTSTSLYHRHAYNNRFQMIETRLGTSSTDSQSWDRGALIFYYSNKARTAYQPFSNQDDNNGNVSMAEHYVPVTVSGGTVTSYAVAQRDRYEYDALNRIQSVVSEQMTTGYSWSQVASQTFAYDRWGNRTLVTGQTAQSWSTTEAAATNRLKLTTGNQCTGVKNGLCYDAAGNVVFDNQLGASGDRTYDAENRMISATTANKYVYDADGRRVRRQVGASQYWQVYGIGGELVAEYQWNGSTATLLKEYGSGGGASVVAEGSTVRWLVSDHLGTPRMIADQTGNLSGITRHDYLPFGEENFAGSVRMAGNGYQPEGVRQKFTGYERDGETALDFAQARYYSNLLGRFTSIDPLISSAEEGYPQSWNRYSYVGNHPLRLTDPTGLIWAKRGNEYRWFDNLTDKDVTNGWKAVTEFVIYVGGDLGYIALNPLRREGQAGFATKFMAEQAVLEMVTATDKPTPYHTTDGAGEVAGYIGIAGALKKLAVLGFGRLFVRKAAASGAREITAAEAEAAFAAAEAEYAAIRSSVDDIAAIAQNTGWAASRIARIKDHIFLRTHQLRDGVRRFDADPEIAAAWKRLQTGSHTSKDIQLLRHELFESKFEGIFKVSYEAAHKAANRAGRPSGIQ